MLLVIVLAIISGCVESAPSDLEIAMAKYKYMITQNGPYNAWNGGPQWVYFCDGYEYANNHYKLFDSAGRLLFDFNLPDSHRIEIREMKHEAPK
jgi:hypothetical protein